MSMGASENTTEEHHNRAHTHQKRAETDHLKSGEIEFTEEEVREEARRNHRAHGRFAANATYDHISNFKSPLHGDQFEKAPWDVKNRKHASPSRNPLDGEPNDGILLHRKGLFEARSRTYDSPGSRQCFEGDYGREWITTDLRGFQIANDPRRACTSETDFVKEIRGRKPASHELGMVDYVPFRGENIKVYNDTKHSQNWQRRGGREFGGIAPKIGERPF